MSKGKRNIEVSFSPALFPAFRNPEAIAVITDILRATSAIVTAFENGVERIIPVGTLEEAMEYKDQGFMVAAERDGIVSDFADFGNSPFNFTPERVSGKQIVYSTTNGTQAINMASDCHRIVIGAYLNFDSLFEWLLRQDRNVIILCAGWKSKFNLEDSLYAGALTDKLISTGKYETICDSAKASVDLWKLAENNLLGYIDKVAQRERLRKNKLDDVIEYCHTFNVTEVLPALNGDHLKNIQRVLTY
jgi:2-phosphosulfolactate phosphatase